MSRTVSATDANHHVSEVLDQAIGGEVVTITKHGRPVAQLVPYDQAAMNRTDTPAWGRLLATLGDGVHLGGDWSGRDAFYDR